jgi:hypothetical protein
MWVNCEQRVHTKGKEVRANRFPGDWGFPVLEDGHFDAQR